MGQTLTHGVYLPDEGERNCYSGLAANWQLLDGSVGTIAAHTAALAGKAPLVHTHGKADITDFPAYGNTAGTICEGNDSRLSDARTPVAHTHTKSDVTDLLNSNFIPSANNSYDLGSSSYQWNNLYAKNYFYNGTAWGLDKENAWTNFNRFNGYRLNIKNYSQEIGVLPTSNQWSGFSFVDKNNNQTISFEHALMPGETRFKISMVDNVASHNSDSTVWIEFLRLTAYAEGSGFVVGADLRPLNNNLNLGSSTNKWKTLNGINPGALSLPNVNAVTGSSNTQLQDISGDLVQDQYFNCYFTPRMDGWAYIALDCSNATIRSGHSSYTVSVKTARGFANSIYTQSFTKNENAFSNVQIFIPVTANKEITLECSFTGFSVTKGYVIPCLGNV